MATRQQIAQPAITPVERIERQYHNVLAQRWLGYTVRASLVSSTVIFALLWPCTEFSKRAILPLTGLISALIVIGVYPVLATHRLALMYPTPPPIHSNFIGLITSELRTRRSWWLILAHGLSGFAFASAYALVKTVYGIDVKLGLFNSTPRYPWHLNERFIFIASANVSISVVLASAHIVQGRVRLHWPNTWSPLSNRVRARLIYIPSVSMVNSVTVPLVASFVYPFIYAMLRRSIITTIIAVIPVFRPFIVNFARTIRWPIWATPGELLYLVALTTLATQPFTRLMEPYLTQPPDFGALIRASPLTPEAYLLDALKSKNGYYLHFTLSELERFASDPSRRRRLFSDVPSATYAQPAILNIWEQLLLHLGRRHSSLVTSFTTSTDKQASPTVPKNDQHSIRAQQANIFRPLAPPKQSPLVSTLQSVLDGPVAVQPPAVVAKGEKLALEASRKASEAAWNVENRVQRRVEGNRWGEYVVRGVKGVWRGTRGGWEMKRRYTGREWAERGWRGGVQGVEVLEGLLDVIVIIAVASLEEDTYGYIQRVLAGTMELVIRHRAALISARGELIAGAAGLGSSGGAAREEIEKGMGYPILLCERSIQRISDAFGTSLSAFKFPVWVGRELKEICDLGLEGDKEDEKECGVEGSR